MRREKAIYHTLNKLSMDASRRVLVAEAWVPAGARARVAEALRRAAEAGAAPGAPAVLQPLVTGDAPPTYFRTDAFTGGARSAALLLCFVFLSTTPCFFSVLCLPAAQLCCLLL